MNANHDHERIPSDMGGDPAGAIDKTDHGMTFWQKQVNGLVMSVVGGKIAALDELRRAGEDLGDEYFELEYFERTAKSLRDVLLEKEIITPEELDAKMVEIRARFDVPDEMASPIKQGAKS